MSRRRTGKLKTSDIVLAVLIALPALLPPPPSVPKARTHVGAEGPPLVVADAVPGTVRLDPRSAEGNI